MCKIEEEDGYDNNDTSRNRQWCGDDAWPSEQVSHLAECTNEIEKKASRYYKRRRTRYHNLIDIQLISMSMKQSKTDHIFLTHNIEMNINTNWNE